MAGWHTSCIYSLITECYPPPGAVHDGVETMSDRKNRAVSKRRPNGLLNKVIGLEVDGSGGLIQDEDLGLPEQRSC